MKHRFIILVWWSVLWCSVPALRSEAAVLFLKDEAVTAHAVVRVRDVALMESHLRNRIGDLVIAVAPGLGQSLAIQKNELHDKLVGNGMRDPQIKGAERVTVHRKGVVIEPAYFKEKIRDYVVAHSRWKDKNAISVDIVGAREVVVPAGNLRHRLTPANGRDLFGSVLFYFRAFSPDTGEEVHRCPITARLNITAEVAVSNHPIGAGREVTAADIRWEKRELTAFTRNAILDGAEIIGHKTGRGIPANTVITERMRAREHLVKRGHTAVLTARLGGVRATTEVKVLADGGMGDRVRVMNLNSKKILSASVVGRNSLEVTVQ